MGIKKNKWNRARPAAIGSDPDVDARNTLAACEVTRNASRGSGVEAAGSSSSSRAL